MDPGGAAANDDLDGLLHALDETDAALRALYRQLAENPDLASENDSKLKELHAMRTDLAQRVGLAMLARRRASVQGIEAPCEPTPPVLEPGSKTGDANGAAVEAASESGPTPDESRPASAPASDADLAKWKSNVRSAGLGVGLNRAPSDSTAWPLVLHELMETLGPPKTLDTGVDVIEETDALDAVGTPSRQAQWARLPRNAQQAWLSVLVARTRSLKEVPSASAGTKAKVKEIIGRYPPWAKAHTPGHVNGMQVKHVPMHGSWAQDGQSYWGILDDLLGEELEAHAPPASKKRPKRSSRDEDDETSAIDPAWRLLPLVRGQRAVILGGDPREPNRERLERAFQLASLEWPAIEGPRKVGAAVERIRKGAYGLVLVLTPFVFHTQSNPIIEAAKGAGVSWALVEGYGIATVKLGLERFLGGPRSATSLRTNDDEAALGK